MNEFKKRWAVLRRNLETGIIEGYCGKPYYKWHAKYLYFDRLSSWDKTNGKTIKDTLGFDVHLYKKMEYQEHGKLTHEYFITRLNSKNCPIKTYATCPTEINDFYKKLLCFEPKILKNSSK